MALHLVIFDPLTFGDLLGLTFIVAGIVQGTCGGWVISEIWTKLGSHRFSLLG